MIDRLQLYENGLESVSQLLAQYPSSGALLSVKNQIQYLLDLEQGVIADRSRLKEITIGALTAREIEPLDDAAAEIFYQIGSAAKTM